MGGEEVWVNFSRTSLCTWRTRRNWHKTDGWRQLTTQWSWWYWLSTDWSDIETYFTPNISIVSLESCDAGPGPTPAIATVIISTPLLTSTALFSLTNAFWLALFNTDSLSLMPSSNKNSPARCEGSDLKETQILLTSAGGFSWREQIKIYLPFYWMR